VTDSTVTIPLELDGQRADKALSVLLDASRSVARSIIDAGNAQVDGQSIRPSQKLRAGTVIVAQLPEIDMELLPEDDIQFDVVYADDDVLVVDKPAGLVVHPGTGRAGGTLVNGLISRFPDIVGVGQESRWGIVHRLDRGTSGLLVVARSAQAYERLVDMIKARDVSRRYLSVVQGVFTNTLGTVEAPIGRDPNNPTRMHLSQVGRSARTHYRRLAEWSEADASLLSVTLETGRTHQIRVHMRSIGHRILGDTVYGRRGVAGDPGRAWLHARQLGFDHPMTAKKMDFVSALPADLSDSLVSLGEPASGAIVDINGELL
jgi:23S rRNA pseudouridine1911/1915/1917 synthase